MSARVRAVFFDAGQTLIDAQPPVVSVYRDAFAAWGVTAGEESVHAAVHETWREIAARRARGDEGWSAGGGEAHFWKRFVADVFRRVGGGALPDALLAGLVAHFRNPSHWSVYPEVTGVLAALRAAGIRLLVVSNWDSSLPPLLDALGLTRYFDALLVSSLFGASKPARAIFDEAVRLAGVPYAEALHVGDSIHDDYDGARGAGLAALLVDRSGRAPAGVEAIASLSEVVSRVLPGPDASR